MQANGYVEYKARYQKKRGLSAGFGSFHISFIEAGRCVLPLAICLHMQLSVSFRHASGGARLVQGGCVRCPCRGWCLRREMSLCSDVTLHQRRVRGLGWVGLVVNHISCCDLSSENQREGRGADGNICLLLPVIPRVLPSNHHLLRRGSLPLSILNHNRQSITHFPG